MEGCDSASVLLLRREVLDPFRGYVDGAGLDTLFPHCLLCRFRPVIGLLSIPYVLAINLAKVPGVKVRRLPVCRPARGGEELHWRETCD